MTTVREPLGPEASAPVEVPLDGRLDAPADGRLDAPLRTGITLVMTLVVRDEEDILETNLRYHLDRGVDFIYAVDHNSSDGTPDILHEFEQAGVLRYLREEDEIHDQGRRATHLARLAHAELGADWVINNDADEFWWPVAGNLKDVLAVFPERYGKLLAWRHDFLPRPHSDAPFYETMIWRRAQSLTPIGTILEPKAAHRGAADVVVTPGNHDALSPALQVAPLLPIIEILHFPARSYEQFERKVRHLGQGYELLADREPGVGRDQLKLLELLRAGELRAYFDEWMVSEAELARGSQEGVYVKDERLRRFLSDPAAARERGESQQAAELTRCALAARTDVEEAERVFTAATAELEAELAQTAAALAQCTQTLEVIRASKLYRWTAGVRKQYYKLQR